MTSRSTPRGTPGSPKASATSAGVPNAQRTSAPKRRSKPASKPRVARIIAVANQKGGVGKSTTAVSLGAALAELGKKVLVVDLDPQGNASTGLGIRHEAREVTVYDVLAAEAPIDGAIVETPVPGLFAIPSTIDLAGAEIELVSQFSRELRLRKALEPLRGDTFDFVFLDCPPSLGLLTVNALAAARELIVPIQCEYYALEGLGQLLRNVGLVQQNVNADLRLTGIVMTMYDPRTKLSEQVVQEVRRYFGKRVYKTVIPRTVRLSEAPGFGQPITVYDPRSRGAECYRSLAKEVASKLPIDAPLPSFESLPSVVVTPLEPEPRHAPHPLVAEEEPEVVAEVPASADEVTAGPAEEPLPSAAAQPTEPEPEQVVTEAPSPPPEREPLRPASEASGPAGSARVAPPEPPAVHGQAPESEVEVEPEPEREVLSTVELVATEPSPEGRAQVERDVETGRPERPPVAREPAALESELVREVEVPVSEPAAVRGEGAAAEPGPGAEASPAEPDADGSEAWIAALEGEARAEDQAVEPTSPAPTVREIDLEAEPEEAVESSDVIRIADRDAAGDHEPADGEATREAEGSGKRRWRLFRRGGSS